MRESRLFQIIYQLLGQQTLTAPQLAEKLEVSVRTIYRDIEALSAAGVPIYCQTGRGGGICLLQDFVLDRTLLSQQEQQEVLNAMQSLSAVAGEGQSTTLRKLAALFRLPEDDWLALDFSRWGNPQRDNEKFATLKAAILQRRCLRITYAAADSLPQVRVVQPYRLLWRSNAWYLQAFCTLRQAHRIFKLNRIVSWQLLDEHFLPMVPPPLQPDAPPPAKPATADAATQQAQAALTPAGAPQQAATQADIPTQQTDAATQQTNATASQADAAIQTSAVDSMYTGANYDPQPDTATQPPAPPQQVLRFAAEAAYRVYDEFDATQVSRQPDGSLLVTTAMPQDEWLVGYLLSFGLTVDILQPLSLRQTVAERARLLWEKHRTD